MKVLSIRQPWAELIIEGKKKIEIRTWKTNYRGKLLIHASKRVDKKAVEFYGFSIDELLRGYIIGSADLVDVKVYRGKSEFLKDKYLHLSMDLPMKFPVYGFVLENAKRINPIEYKGRLRLFDVGLSRFID